MGIPHSKKEITKFAKFVLPRITEMVKLNGEGALIEVGVEISFDVTNPLVAKWIKAHTGESIKSILDTTFDALKRTLAEGVDAGESISKLAKRVTAEYKDCKGYKAVRIARTETITASNQGALQGYKQSGVVEKKEWLTAFDERTCEECSALDGEVVGLDENFSGGLSTPPAHPNCRCTILPVVYK
ncbi:hypothetical protein ES705_28865 [subsurface metagenome]